jgi:ATP-binding cassette subfamily B protein
MSPADRRLGKEAEGQVGVLNAWATLWRRLSGTSRVAIIRQLTNSDCGAACLAMIYKYHGANMPLGHLRDRALGGRDGSTAATLCNLARQDGFIARGLSCELDKLAELPVPAILHWDFTHFVVLEGVGKRGIQIVDPARGRRHVRWEEVSNRFTGIVLTIQATPKVVPADERRFAARSFIRMILNVPGGTRSLIQILLASILLQVLGLVAPLATVVVVDVVLPSGRLDLLHLFAIAFSTILLTQVLVSHLRGLIAIHMRGKLDSALTTGFLTHLLALPYSYFLQRSGGDLLIRLGSNSLLREVLTSQMLSLVLDGSFAVGYLILMLAISPTIGLLAASIAMLVVGCVWVSRQATANAAEAEVAAKAIEQSTVMELLNGMQAVKAAGAEDAALERWSDAFARQLNASIRKSMISTYVGGALGLLRSAAPLLLLWVGAQLVVEGELTAGVMLGLVTLGGAFLSPIQTLSNGYQQYQTIIAYLDRVADVLDAPAEPQHASGVAALLGGKIAAEGLTFRYQHHGPLAVDNVTLTITPGELVAIVGPTGSGKSTLALLLLGLLEASQGRVRFDGVDLAQLNRTFLRRQIGVVLQNPGLMSGSILQNIIAGSPSASRDDAVEAARLACMHDDIECLPLGYDTPVGDSGGALSGGQRQRVALARALIRRPRILLLDEATSHLDAVTEAAVVSNLDRLGCTRIVIAHRLSTIAGASRVFVLSSGQLVEQGTHEQLAESAGPYASLVRAQLREPGRARARSA